MASDAVITTLREYVEETKVLKINPCVRVNESGYPFLTFLREGNRAENIYFSVASAENLIEGEIIPNERLRTLNVSRYQDLDKDGNPRDMTKITWGRGDYLDVNDIW